MDLQIEVSHAIKQWQSENSKVRTLGVLAHRTGVSYPTLYRMNVGRGGYSFINVFKLIRYLKGTRKTMDILSNHYPFMKDLFVKEAS